MIDFIKIVIYDINLIDIVWNSGLLEFYEEKEKRISIEEIKTYSKKTYKNLIFERFYNRLEISGSIHKFKNQGMHNANDFSFSDSINTIYQIKDLLKLDLSLCIIVNLEYGLNLIPKEDVKNIILWLKYHNRNEFRYFPGLQYAKQSAKFNTNGKVNKYKTIKAYAKGLQLFGGTAYGNENTFRFEVKSKESRYIKSLGVSSLQDLTMFDNYLTLSKKLIEEWRNILLLDKNLRSLNNERLNKYLNSDFWETSINQNRNHFSRHKQKYLSILNQYPENLFQNIENLIKEKLYQFENAKLKRGCNFDRDKNKKEVQFQPYIKVDYAQTCRLTGINISMQKDNSILLSHTGLRYYYERNPDLFRLVKNKYLSTNWINSDYETQIKEIAHNIRNCYHNRKIKQNKLYPSNQFCLFN
jgi:hypothetical protein